MKLRAVFFDAGNTLLEINYGVIAEALRQQGIGLSPDELRASEQKARVRFDEDLRLRSTEGSGMFRRYLGYVLENTGVRWDQRIEAAWRTLRAYNPPVGLWDRAAPHAPRALSALNGQGFIVGCISNSNGSVAQALSQAGIGDSLAFVIDSGIVGVEKPDPRIFHLALERADVLPGEAAYVGDLYSVDVVGARGAGLHPILLDPLGLWPQNDCVKCRDLSEVVALATRGTAPDR